LVEHSDCIRIVIIFAFILSFLGLHHSFAFLESDSDIDFIFDHRGQVLDPDSPLVDRLSILIKGEPLRLDLSDVNFLLRVD